MANSVAEKVQAAGVVGAGGAGFPTHVKLAASVDTYICNAAECEPLLCKDQELMRLHADEIVDGLAQAMAATGASQGVIAIKAKYHAAIETLQAGLGRGMRLHLFDNFYPAGDEVIIVHDVTGRLIPPGGLPLHVGCAVNNVETLINISRAVRGQPVTHTALTVTGAVHQPCSMVVPIGTSTREVLALAGGPTVDDVVLLDGGAMMGKATTDLDAPLTKTSGGFIVLPRDHTLVRRKTQPTEDLVRIARSACDQCTACTELCPRYLLGYAIEPHKVMRTVGFRGEVEAQWAQLGLQCCECSVCSLYACPEDLPPKEMCIRSKEIWRQQPHRPEPLPSRGVAHPLRDHRRVPIPRLIERLGLGRYNVFAPMVDAPQPGSVVLKLRQHIGAPAVPVVAAGESVRQGQLVARVPDGALGAHVHASISGRVLAVDDGAIHLTK